MMNQTEFWKIIDQARQESNNNLQEQVSLVKKYLSQLPLEDIKTFFGTIIPNQRKNSLLFSVQSLKGLNNVINHFQKYPLLTQK